MTESTKTKLKKLQGDKARTPLAQLVQRQMDRWTRQPPVLGTPPNFEESEGEEAATSSRDVAAATTDRDEEESSGSSRKKRRTDAEYRSRESTSGDSSQDLPARLPRAATSRSSHSQASLSQEVSTVSSLLRDTDLHSEGVPDEAAIPILQGEDPIC